MYLLRSDTSNWLWNVSSHITAILMMWPAESIVVKTFCRLPVELITLALNLIIVNEEDYRGVLIVHVFLFNRQIDFTSNYSCVF